MDYNREEFILFAKKKDGKINGMTCGWMAKGYIFGLEVAFIFIRKNRFTYEFISESEYFVNSYVKDKELLAYFGSVSGRDEDKIKTKNLEMLETDKYAVLKGVKNEVFKKIAVLDIEKCDFLDEKILTKWKENENSHVVFIGELLKE